jgi:hypothetical protein
MNYLLDIRVACGCSDLLEGVFNGEGLLHLLFHLLLKELAPHLLYHVVFSQLDLIRVFVFISSCFSNLTLSPDSIHSLLESIFLVSNAGLKRKDPLLSLLLLMINVLHQLVQSVLRLQLILLAFPLLIQFISHDGLL